MISCCIKLNISKKYQVKPSFLYAISFDTNQKQCTKSRKLESPLNFLTDVLLLILYLMNANTLQWFGKEVKISTLNATKFLPGEMFNFLDNDLSIASCWSLVVAAPMYIDLSNLKTRHFYKESL